MSRRNLILLIIVLAVAVIAVVGILFSRQGTTTPGVTGTNTNFFSQFNPFGTSTPTPPPPAPAPVVVTPPSETPPAPEIPVTKLTKVSSMPIAGFAVYSKERLKDIPIVVPATPAPDTTEVSPAGTPPATPVKTTVVKPTPPPTEFVPALRYVDKATGNIFQTFADKIEERKFSSTTIPKVYDAYFGNRGESVVMRYLKPDGDTIVTFVGTLPKELLGGDTTTNNEVKGAFLPDNVKDVSISPDSSKLFYLFESADGIVGTTLSFLTNKKVQIFDSPFTEWLSSWPNSNLITLTTKPSGSVPGYMYSMDAAGKKMANVLSNINGLITLGSPNGKLILYSDNNLSLNVYHTDTRISEALSIRTLPEKCLWGKSSDALYCTAPRFIDTGGYPDAWYQGEVSFLDMIWKIDIDTANTTLLLDPSTISGTGEIDGIKLAADDGENYLFFVNKKDSFLWKLDLK